MPHSKPEKIPTPSIRMFLVPCSCGVSFVVCENYDRQGTAWTRYLKCPNCGKRHDPKNRLLQLGYDRRGYWQVDECSRCSKCLLLASFVPPLEFLPLINKFAILPPAFDCSPTPAVKTANPPLLAPKSANSDSSIRGNSLEEYLCWESRLQYVGRGAAPAFRTVWTSRPGKHSDGS